MEYCDFQGKKLSRLGFGMMRLPQKDGAIDEELVTLMVDRAIESGVNYFDTAWPYHDGFSEIVTGKVLKKYPRDSYYLASKYPGHQHADEYTPEKTFETQLKKCGVAYFDFYLLHNICESSIGVYKSDKWKILEYFVEQKKLGRIKHLGFSTHGELATIKDWLDYAGPHMEFCQLQVNYLDWTLQKAKDKYELLTERGIPVWVMEPVRGGRLANLSDTQTQKLQALRSSSTASWAFDWLRALPNVGVILSGMSNLEQTMDNLKTFSRDQPLNEAEQQALLDIVHELHTAIPCTGCRYCTPYCPKELDIPALLSVLNEARFVKAISVGMRLEAMPEDKQPTACIGCGACAAACPQKIDIPGLMAEFVEMMPSIPSWKALCAARAEAEKKFAAK